jgi:hypothetical protein
MLQEDLGERKEIKGIIYNEKRVSVQGAKIENQSRRVNKVNLIDF